MVWREFGVLSLDQWVLGNGQVFIWDHFRCGLMRQSPIFDSGLIISLSHPTPVSLVWREFGVLNLDLWVLGSGQVSISDHFRCGFDAPESNL